jgi:hypothetical protein
MFYTNKRSPATLWVTIPPRHRWKIDLDYASNGLKQRLEILNQRANLALKHLKRVNGVVLGVLEEDANCEVVIVAIPTSHRDKALPL